MKNLEILDWSVSVNKLEAVTHEGDILETPFYGVTRNDTQEVFKAVTSRYSPVQNEQLIEVLTAYFGQEKMKHAEAHITKGGARTWIKIPNKIMFPNTIAELKSWFCIKNSFDGSSGLQLGLLDKITVCTNGMVIEKFIKDFQFRHTESLNQMVSNFSDMFKIFNQHYENHYADLKQWQKTPITWDEALKAISYMNKIEETVYSDEYYEKYYEGGNLRKYNAIEDQLNSIELEMNRQGDNKFALLQGVTHYTNHVLVGKDIHEGIAKTMNQRMYNYLATN